MRNGLIVFAIAGLASILARPGRAQWRTPWSYDGAREAEHWSDLDPEYAACNAGKAQSPIDIAGVEIDPNGLLPRDTGYYTYMGSLTAPPCTEGVSWFVLKSPVEISPNEIGAFAKLYPHDVRPPQPLNGRVVKESQ